jgi:hypothetical protein
MFISFAARNPGERTSALGRRRVYAKSITMP